MKKLISLITSFALLSAFPISSTTAAEATDLKSLASQLGADTDYFSFPNYRPTECSDELIMDLAKTWQVNAKGAAELAYQGLCNSFSVLEILNHNGVISPSDLQEGAETLRDVECTPYVNDVMVYYSAMQDFDLQSLVYHEYFCSHTPQEQCQDLIKYGEKAVETGKWFFIAFGGPTISHAIVGIGIADGNWTYNGKKYDKCILTLDSNFQDKNDPTKAAGFTEKACIYINSEKNEFYFPAYDCDSENEDTFITLVTDDTDMLNNLGYINPSSSHSTEYDDIKKLLIRHSMCGEYDVTIESDGKAEIYHGIPKKPIDDMGKNQWTPNGSNLGAEYFKTIDKITIESMQADEQELSYHIKDINGYNNHLYVYGKSRVSYSDNEYTFKNLDDKRNRLFFHAIRGNSNDMNNKFTFPWKGIGVEGTAEDSVTMKVCNEGSSFTSNEDFIAFDIHLSKYDYDEQYELIGTYQDIKLFSVNDVMIRCKENSDEIYFAIGEDFDTPVEKGDVNCDGNVNAVDASFILTDYANASTDQKTFLNTQLADYNSDGAVNAIDASCVLAEYARLSTT